MINAILIQLIAFLPKRLIKPFAAPYVAGTTMDDAFAVVKALNKQGFATTIDILGEHTESKAEAAKICTEYLKLYQRIAEEQLDANISLKLTHLGLELSPKIAEKNILTILKQAQKYNNFLRIDMENSPYTDATIDIYKNCLKVYNRVGTVLQAYLFRTADDIDNLNSNLFNCRICKGIYRESAKIAYQDKLKIRNKFIENTISILKGDGYAAIATHDLKIIDQLDNWITDNKIPSDRFEFQVMYGVPMGNRLQRLLDSGYKVRYYVPYGEAWFNYSLRRLKENPSILWYVASNIFKN